MRKLKIPTGKTVCWKAFLREFLHCGIWKASGFSHFTIYESSGGFMDGKMVIHIDVLGGKVVVLYMVNQRIA